ncbi:prepilin peptidase [Allosphingosinicella flava]|uniref:Prepilin peptidase n=1 Tax=Allosphingosinicella flava TaxID=2771430 RepID=A0A7T2LN21_9SPHN|nr:prepilin peptidase [Sphingosinicella flava]QPQ55898.1 prepilin peptidase [Sphingosinicella flava]
MGHISYLLLGLLIAMLIAAAIWDLRSRTIPNGLNAAIALAAIPYWLSLGLSFWPAMAVQAGIALLVFILFAIVFALGAMGGGDVKMVAAVSLWLAPGATLTMLLVMSLAGGVLTLVMVAGHHLTKSRKRLEIPYGVAIAFAGIWVVGERFLNHFS